MGQVVAHLLVKLIVYTAYVAGLCHIEGILLDLNSVKRLRFPYFE